GVTDQLRARGYPVHGVSLRRGGREIARFTGRLDQSGHPAPRPDQPFREILVVNQAEVEGVLRARLAELGGRVELQRELRDLRDDGDGLVAQVAERASDRVERVAARWLVGCDGAHSTVRHLLRLPMAGEEYPEHLVNADVHLRGDLPRGVTVRWLNDEGLLAGIPFREPGVWRLMAVVTADAQGNVPAASV